MRHGGGGGGGDVDAAVALPIGERNLDLRDGAICVRTLQAALTAAARAQPWLLVMDDLQWFDELTLRFVEGLAEARGAERDTMLLVLCLCRTDEELHGVATMARSASVRAMTLPALPPHAVRDIVSDVLGRSDISPDLLAVITECAAGNPLHAGEVVRIAQMAARRSGQDIETALAELPSTLDALIAYRLDALPAPARRVLYAAAVLGRSCSRTWLASALGRSETDVADAVVAAQQLGLVELLVDQHFHFVHDKTREVAYRQLDPAERIELHGIAARALESGAQARLSGVQ